MTLPLFTPSGRWTPLAKQKALAAIRSGEIDRAEFLQANAMSEDELARWERAAAKRRGFKVASLVAVDRNPWEPLI